MSHDEDRDRASDSPPRPARALPRRLATAALLALLYAIGACALLAPDETPRQGWNEKKWGPLVPHKSFPGDCSLCHLPDRWDALKPDFTFDHERATGVALEGAHGRAACLRCHNDRGPVKEFLAHGCGGCHVDPHEERLGSECTRCHDQDSWRPTGMIATHAQTRLPLVGAHLAIPCDRCHQGAHVGNFVGAPVECEICHGDDLARATNPDHVALGYTHDCQRCHTPTAWDASHFAHSAFPLVGVHRVTPCTSCHQNGVFGGTPRDCFSCHVDDYNATTNPNHASAGFGTNCETCHTPIGWVPSTFNHTPYFPITSGKHAGFACADCHTTGVYSAFSCIDCHAHDKASSDDRHSGVPGYSWSSPACYTCHPDGRVH